MAPLPGDDGTEPCLTRPRAMTCSPACRILAGMHDAPTIPRLTAHDERRAAVAAGVDPRTIRAYLDPARRARMHSTTVGRIEETLRTLDLLPSTTEAPH